MNNEFNLKIVPRKSEMRIFHFQNLLTKVIDRFWCVSSNPHGHKRRRFFPNAIEIEIVMIIYILYI